MFSATRHSGFLAAVLTLVTASAFAHTGLAGHSHSGLEAGFAHPFSGVDHLLAMVAVGLWAAQRGGRLTLGLPAVFVGVMMLGGVAALGGLPVPMVESGIAASVLGLGLLVATAAKLPAAPSLALVGLFAFFHGHAHGTELPAMAGGAGYTFGFAAATALLHGAGIGLALGTRRLLAQDGHAMALRASGVAVSLAGAFLLLR